MPRASRIYPWAVVLGGILLLSLAWKGHPLKAAALPYYAWDISSFSDTGEALLHGFNLTAEVPLYHMPLTDVLAALLWNHGPASLQNWWGPISQAAVMILVLALGCLLSRLECGLLAACLYLALGTNVSQGGDHYVEVCYSLLLLTTAGVMVWDAERPTVRKNFLLGLALGTTLLFRSAVFLLPGVLALREWARSAGRGYNLRLKLALSVGLVPFLLLAPWILLNWIVSGEFTLFERRQADVNIVTGAMGLVRGVEDDWRMLRGALPDLHGASALLWAIQEIIRHPLSYGWSCLQRMKVVAGYEPVLLAAATASLLYFRRRAAFQRLGLLIACFIAAHCLLAVQYRYFIPLWPLLAVLGACLASPLLGRVEPPWAEAVRRASQGAALTALTLALTVCALTLNAMGIYAARSWSHSVYSLGTLERVLRAAPNDPWLLSRRGRTRMLQGDSRGAVADFSRALARRPLDDERRLDHAAALAMNGRISPLLRYRFDHGLRPHLALRARLLTAVACLRQGRAAQGAAFLRQAVEDYDSLYVSKEEAVSTLEGINRKRLWSEQDKFGYLVLAQFAEGWVPDVAGLTERLLALSPAHVNLDLSRAATEALLGQNRAAEALAVTDRFVRSATGRDPAIQAQAHLLRAQVLLKLKNYGGAERDFSRAEALAPQDAVTLNTLVNFLTEREKNEEALAYMDRLAKASENAPPIERAGVYLRKARIQRKLKDEAGAEGSLMRALEIMPDGVPALKEIVEFKLAQHRSKESLAYIDRLAKAVAPADRVGVYWRKARVQRELQDEAGAKVSLMRVLEIDPDNAAALRTMAEHEVSRHRPAEALAYIDRLIKISEKASPSDRAGIHWRKAQIQRELKDEAGAEASLMRALEIAPADAAVFQEVVQLKLAQNRPEEALSIVAGHRPSDVRLQAQWLVLRGFVRALRKENFDYKEDFISAVRLDPKSACFEQILLRNRERLDPVYFDLCIERFPRNPPLYMERGIARYLSGRQDGALDDFRKAIELKPDYLEAYLSLASALITRDRPAEALATADKAVALAKDRKDPVYERITALQSSLREKRGK